MTLSIESSIQKYAPLVDQRLREIISSESEVPNLHEGLLYSMGLDKENQDGGKRLRPILCLAAAESLGGNPDDALGFACAIEMMHNFALVHDDIEDGDVTRRDRPSTWIHYGLGHGINIGDYLFCKVWSTLLADGNHSPEKRLELLQLMSTTLDHTHVGQALDMNARDTCPDTGVLFQLEDYYRLVREKTGYYLAAPILGGAVVSGASEPVMEAIREFGHYAGPLFQITDDTLDFTEGKGRGGVLGSDIREGKRSFLVAYVSENGTEEQIRELYRILNTTRDETTDEMVESAIDLFNDTGATVAARNECLDLMKKAKDSLTGVPDELGSLLEEFAQSLVDRKK